MSLKMKRLILLLLSVLFLLSSCSCSQSSQASVIDSTADSEVSSEVSTSGEKYLIPPFKDSGYNSSEAIIIEGIGGVDLSSSTKGYVALEISSEAKFKFQLISGDVTYTYDVLNENDIYPFNMGNGKYKLRLMQNISGDKYAEAWSGEYDITMDDEFEAFLRPNQIVNYNDSSECVKKAKELASACSTDIDVVSKIYDYLVKNISYDKEKAANVKSGYIPNPDSTLAEKKGICYDYASLAAAMMRSLGIPCQTITGYVAPNDVYHAWNKIYISNQGWVTVEIKANSDDWKRIDITYAASGVETAKLNDDSLYTTKFVY